MSETEDNSVELKTDIELVELDTLDPYANNPKQHPDEQVAKIADSIENQGCLHTESILPEPGLS